jgi:hypothetical protein
MRWKKKKKSEVVGRGTSEGRWCVVRLVRR